MHPTQSAERHLPPQRRAHAEQWMAQARHLAATTPTGDIPVACIIIDPTGRIVGQGVNEKEHRADPTAHAEILAIRQAVAVVGDSWRLHDCTLVVTLEPCAMCAGALQAARIKTVIFGAYEPKTGACGSVIDVLRDNQALHVPEVIGGIQETECQQLLYDFFQAHRRDEADHNPVD